MILQYWTDSGEGRYSDWLRSTYLPEQWSNWFATCAIPGITPSQNALESHHRVIKQACVSSLRASTATVINESLLRILAHQTTAPTRLRLSHYCEGKIIYACSQLSIFNTFTYCFRPNTGGYYHEGSPAPSIQRKLLHESRDPTEGS